LNPVDPQLDTTWFQRLRLSSEFLGSKFCLKVPGFQQPNNPCARLPNVFSWFQSLLSNAACTATARGRQGVRHVLRVPAVGAGAGRPVRLACLLAHSRTSLFPRFRAWEEIFWQLARRTAVFAFLFFSDTATAHLTTPPRPPMSGPCLRSGRQPQGEVRAAAGGAQVRGEDAGARRLQVRRGHRNAGVGRATRGGALHVESS
jgi:hypothetical protein